MTAKEYFENIKCKAQAIDVLEEKLKELELDMTAIGGFDYSKPVVQTSPTNAMEEKILRATDAFNELLQLKKEYIEDYKEMEIRLSKLSKASCAQAIRLRYFGKKRKETRWGWVAEEMGYSEDRAKHLFREGMDEFEELFLKST